MAQPLKVTCPSCNSKFHIPVHLVRGKVVSFRCKKCRGTIPVDGRALSTATPMPLPAPQVTPPEGWQAARPSSPPPPPEAFEQRVQHYSEPPMRLSLSDGLVVHENVPSTSGLQVDTPAAFSHSNAPSQRVAVPGASRTPPWGLGPPTVASAPPPPLSRTEPPEAIPRSDPPPSFRSQNGSKKVIFGAALIAAASLTIWGVSVRSPSGGAAPASNTQADRPAAETKAAVPEPARAAPAAAAPEPVKPPTSVAALPAAKEPEAAPTKPARAKGRAAKAAPAIAEAPAEVAAVEEPAPAAPLTGSAAAAQEATNSAAQEIDFNKEAARQALDDAGQRAASCRTIDTPAGAARIAVTFAPAGNVTSAMIESGPLVGTAAGGCVASKFRSVRVPAFTGEPITVHKSISF